MRRWMYLGMAATLALSVSACAGDRSPEIEDNEAVGTSGTMDGGSNFVQKQLAMGKAEVETSELAQRRASHPDVKEFASMMVRDHQAANDQLRQIANNRTGQTGETETDRPGTGGYEGDREPHEMGAVGTSGVDPMHGNIREELSDLSGREFDRKYIDHMIQDHEQAIRELEDRANDAANTEVQQWASSTLPKIREHLDRAKQIQQKLESDGSKR